jgi:hypothetical protein
MANIGQFNTLKVVAITASGVYLAADALGEVLLPNRYTPINCQIDDEINVFIYADSANRLVATTVTPLAQVNQFASLKVAQINKMGAFLDWGLPKELLVPYNQQHSKMEQDKYYLVRIYLDPETQRLIASSKIDRFIDVWPADYQQWDKVELIIGGKTDLGFKAIINDTHWGLLYDNEIFQPLRIGKKVTGYIKNIRQDGRIDLSLARPGEGKVNDLSAKLLAHIEAQNGFSSLHDKSSPELIKKTLGISKKAFKATIGHLMKIGKISIEANGIRLK